MLFDWLSLQCVYLDSRGLHLPCNLESDDCSSASTFVLQLSNKKNKQYNISEVWTKYQHLKQVEKD